MCGIVGVARHPGLGSIGLANVEAMANQIVHRGPNDAGFHAAAEAIIGMRRLSIIDLSGGHQPIANEDETVWVVCNGEIYNFRELRAQLEVRGHRFKTQSDTEVIVHLYEEYGERLFERLAGMYAIALWDASSAKLLVARDRMGIKPVYFAERDGFFSFASEVKSLLALPFMRADIDRDALGEYLALGYATAPRTLFRGIRKLPPASYLAWQRGRLSETRYWQLPTSVDRSRSEADWVAEIGSELDRAVDEHLVSDVPLGAFLSGGLDSSTIVALMAKRATEPVRTYAIGYSGSGAANYYNELSFAAEVASAYRTQHTEILVSPNLATLLPKLLWHIEEPISDGATVTTHLVAELAAKSVTVILSGVGGDELFAGYNRYLGDHYGRRYRRVPAWLRKTLVAPLAQALPSGRANRFMDLARYAKKFVRAGELDWRAQYRLFLEVATLERASHLLLHPYATPDGFAQTLAAEQSEDALLRLMRVDAQTQLPEDLLLLTDKITMAHSLECRVPFLDHRLVELAAQVPADVKLRGGQLKHVLRRVAEGLVPPSVLARSKRGFGAPFGEWFKGELRPLRARLINAETVQRRGLLSWPAVQRVLQLHDSGREDFSDLVLVLVNLELWCRMFLDHTAVSDIADELSESLGAA